MRKISKNFLIFLITLSAFLPALAWSKESSKKSDQRKEFQSSMQPQKFTDDDEFETYETGDVIEIYDPLEKYNRKIYSFNDAVDRYFLEHVARTYRSVAPQTVRKSARNFLVNLSLPISALNSFLQGKVDNGLATFSNFLINTTIGVGGLFDVAGEKNLRYRQEDFGQTLGHYDIGSGAYIMLPILGPSTTRDFGGWSVDKAVNPLAFNAFDIAEKNLLTSEYRFGLIAASGIDTRESLIDVLDDIRADSFDPYATIRSAYLQKRATDIKN